jgi:hypothetical protein
MSRQVWPPASIVTLPLKITMHASASGSATRIASAAASRCAAKPT